MCGKALSTEAVSTLGEQRKYNYALQPMSREEFVKMVSAEQPEVPDYFVHDAILNRQDRPTLDTSMQASMRALALDEVLKLQAAGAQVVDTRDAAEFAGAHFSGALNIGIDGKYATWAGTMLKRDKPIVVIADDERVEESIMRLGRIGFDHVKGYLQGGMDALRDRSELLAQIQRITAPALDEHAGELTIIDVRTAKEWEAGHIEGSLNLPLHHLADHLADVPASGDGRRALSGRVSFVARRQFAAAARLHGTSWIWSAATRPGQPPSCP